MTGEGTISEVVGAEAAAGWFTSALIATCGRSAVEEKDFAVNNPVATAADTPPMTEAQHSTRRWWSVGALKLIMFMVRSVSGDAD